MLVLTIATALTAQFVVGKTAAMIILLLASIKFLLVAFQFMELKKAHPFWKGMLITFLVFFILLLVLLLK